MSSLTHLDDQGQARMVDVRQKTDTHREAVARGSIMMHPDTLALIQTGDLPKGDVFAVARIAGIMGAKKTHDLIPMCHPLPLTYINLDFIPQPAENTSSAATSFATVQITATTRVTGKTGVEMEALTAVSLAALTIYDMCKAVDKTMRIEDIHLIKKTGGKSGDLLLDS